MTKEEKQAKRREKWAKLKGFIGDKAPLIGNAIGSFLPDAGVLGVVKNLISKDDRLPDADKLSILAEINSYEIEMAEIEAEVIKSHHDLEKVQLSQDDLFTKRARPFRQYFWLLLIAACVPVAFFVTGSPIELPWELWSVIGADMGIYSWNRSKEKQGVPITNPLKNIFK